MTSSLGSRAWRVLRWFGLSASIPALWACNARSFEAPALKPQSSFETTFQESINRELDLLFMIDNSSSMNSAQMNLEANMPSFMNVLKGLAGGLPDLHIAVVTSDMGVGPTDAADNLVDNCSAAGDDGAFQAAPTGGCTATGLDPGAAFITDTGGASPVTNFGTRDITDVFSCITGVGASGCGFEHQLASVAHALGADNIIGGKPMPPTGNAGFLRDDAYLGIVLLTNEDDCSAPPDSPLWTPPSTSLGSPFGPTRNFVCNEFGHLCVPPGGGAPVKPSRRAPNTSPTDTVTYSPAGGPDNCVSAEADGMLTPVGGSGFAGQIKALKADPASQILVASISGPTTEYTVTWETAPVADAGPWPVIRHACGSDSDKAGFADPGVRLLQFVREFGNHGLFYPFCSTDYGPALTEIATALGQLLGPKCVTGTIASRPGSNAPDCTVTDVSGSSQTVVPACATAGAATPCWTLEPGTGPLASGGNGCAADEHVLEVMRGGAPPPNNTKSAVNCLICTPGQPDPSRGCP